jgi:hypothetical protein
LARTGWKDKLFFLYNFENVIINITKAGNLKNMGWTCFKIVLKGAGRSN